MQFGPIYECWHALHPKLTLAKMLECKPDDSRRRLRGKLQRCRIYLKQMGVTAFSRGNEETFQRSSASTSYVLRGGETVDGIGIF